jgi:hypothetical protein
VGASTACTILMVLALCLLIHEVVGSCDIVVTVRFDALHCVVCIETELLQNLLINRVIKRHELLLRKETLWTFVFELFKPGMCADFLNSVSFFWLYL